MRIGVLGNAESWYVEDLRRAARERGLSLTRLDFRQLMGEVKGAGEGGVRCGEWEMRRGDVLIVRTMPPGSLEQVVFRMDALAACERMGVWVLNPAKSLECAIDKYLTTTRLAARGLPVPRTCVCEGEEDALAAFAVLGGDVVVKPIFGSEGRGILRVSDPDLAVRTFRTLERIQGVLYLQEYVEHEGFDVRVLVLGGKVIGGMKRRSEGDFRTNVSRNGRGEQHDVNEREAELAVQACAVTGAEIAGVDLLYSKRGECYVIEVNAVPGWRAFGKVTGIDVAGRLMDFLLQERG